jgi:uncharacterized repeat protein (TIGR01451 family)
MSNLPRRLTAGLLLSCALGTTTVLSAAPAFAAAKATLVVAVASSATPQPGKTVTYTISVHNTGTVGAGAVQLEMTTDTPITGISAKVTSGRCYRSSLETACIFGTVKAGATATATISGTLPKNAPLYSDVTVTTKVTSSTALTAPAWSMLVYPIGGPSPQPVRPSPPPPAASAAEPVAAHQDAEGAAQWLQPTGLTRALAIGFALFVIGLIVAGRLWERRRPALAAGHADTEVFDRPEPLPSQAGPDATEALDVTQEQ